MTKARQGKDKQGKQRKPFDVDAARQMYEAGTHKIRDLAAWSNYCYGTVRRRLLEAGVVLDKPGGNRRKRKDAPQSTPEEQAPPQDAD